MGCAPAYIALAVEALIEAGVEAGLDEELSSQLVSEAAAGVGRHLLTREPGSMQRAIASPGGSTEAGLEALAERDVHDSFKAAVEASLERMRGIRMTSAVLARRDRSQRRRRTSSTTSSSSTSSS